MSVGYSVEVRNKFEMGLADSDEDPFDLIAKCQSVDIKDSKSRKKERAAKAKKAKSQTVAVETKPAETKDNANRQDKPLHTKQRNFSEDRPNRDLAPRRQDDRRQDDGRVPPRRADRPRQEEGRVFHGEGGFQRGEVFRGGRGGRGGRGVESGEHGRFGQRGRGGDGKRHNFDRHSGSVKTGTKAMEKRQGGGAHNWGTVKDDIEGTAETAVNTPATTGATEGNPDWNGPAEDVENQQPQGQQVETENEVALPTEQEPVEMSLDEYKAKMIKERPAATFNVRQPGEGCDVKQWSKTFVLQKKDIDSQSESEEEEDDDDDYRQKKNVLKIELKFADSRSGGRGGRGGNRGGMERGGGRGRGGRGGRGGPAGPNTGRGGRQAPQIPTFGESDFPTLLAPNKAQD